MWRPRRRPTPTEHPIDVCQTGGRCQRPPPTPRAAASECTSRPSVGGAGSSRHRPVRRAAGGSPPSRLVTAPTPFAARVSRRHERDGAAGRLPILRGVGAAGRHAPTRDAAAATAAAATVAAAIAIATASAEQTGGAGVRRALAQDLVCGEGRRAGTDAAEGEEDIVVTHRAELLDLRGRAELCEKVGALRQLLKVCNTQMSLDQGCQYSQVPRLYLLIDSSLKCTLSSFI